MAKKTKKGSDDTKLTSPQKAVLKEAKQLQRKALSARLLSSDKPDQFPRLAPNKGARKIIVKKKALALSY